MCIGAETITRLFDYSVGMALFDLDKHYLIIRITFKSELTWMQPTLKPWRKSSIL